MARSTTGFDLTQDTTLAICLQLTDILGNVLGFTEHDRPLTFDISDGNGDVIYLPDAAFQRSVIEARSGGRVGTMDLIGFLDSAGIDENNLFAGRYDGALVKIFFVDWTRPRSGIIWLEIGEFGETGLRDEQATLTFRSILDRYNATEIGDFYEAQCIHIFGSKPGDIPRPFANIGCRVQLSAPEWTANTEAVVRTPANAKPPASGSPTQVNTVRPTVENGRIFEVQTGGVTGGSEPSWNTTLGATTNDGTVVWIARQALVETGTVLSVTSQRELVISYAGDAASNYYRRGRMKFTSGANAGLFQHIKSHAVGSPAGDISITTWKPWPYTINPTDAVEVTVGCDRKLTTCVNTFRNRENFGGFAVFAPATDEVFKIPKQTA